MLSLEGYDNINEVLHLVGREIYVMPDQLPELADDEYYWCDLLGLQVIDRAVVKSLGKLVDIISTGSNDVYVVQGGGREYLSLLWMTLCLRSTFGCQAYECQAPRGAARSMKFEVLTLFPAMFVGPLTESILKRAREKGLIEVTLHNIRDYAVDRHSVTDDYPYGGGAGMVMKVEPLAACIEQAKANCPKARVILTTPRGRTFNHAIAEELAQEESLIIICGRYEGVDERIMELFVDEEISLGDFVLTGGEMAAMVMIDAVSRLVPGVLGSDESASNDSFSDGLLEYPQYTRPPEFRGLEVPKVLLSGNHQEIEKWRRQKSLSCTADLRPDLLETAHLSDADRKYLKELQRNSK